MPIPEIDQEFLLNFLTGLLNTPSPTGYTEAAVEYTRQALAGFPGLELGLTHKGALVAGLPGQRADAPRALTAHVDTLGAMVKEIKTNGRLKLTRIGGLVYNAIETEGCTVFTNQGGRVRGSVLIDKASSHVHNKATTDTPRDDEHMEVRLDARTCSPEETRDWASRWVILWRLTRGWS